MFTAIIYSLAAAAAQPVDLPTQADEAFKGPCPAAYVDYAGWKRKHRDGWVPIRVLLDARDGLRRCAKAGVKVPYTVAEYNQREVMDEYTELRIKRDITPSRPWGEF